MAKGFKTGGRKAGTPNKIKAEKALVVAEATAHAVEAGKSGRRLAVTVLSEAMNFFYSRAAFYQPTEANKENANETKFTRYLKMAASIAKDLASFETPKLQSTAIQPAKDDDDEVTINVRFI